MATIKELKEQLKIERNKSKALEEIQDIGKERKKLKKQIKTLKFRRKFGKAIKASRAISKGASKFAKGLSAGAKVLAAAEARERQRRKKTGANQFNFEDTIMNEIPR